MLKQKGQTILEYAIVFVMLALLTLLSLSAFFPKAQQAGEDLGKSAIERIIE